MTVEIRDDILEAAAQLFEEQGYERATLDDIAKAVGIKKGSLYYHIRSKEDLLFALHQRLANELISNTRQALKAAESPEQRLRAIIRVAMRLIAEHKEEVTVFLHERHVLNSERWREVVSKRNAYQRMVEEVIADGIEAGVFQQVSVKVATLGVLGMTNWGYQWFRRDGSLSWEQIAELFADIMLNGLKK